MLFHFKIFIAFMFTLWDATVIQCGVRTSCETPWSIFIPIRFPAVLFFKPHMNENLISKFVMERKMWLQNKWKFFVFYFFQMFVAQFMQPESQENGWSPCGSAVFAWIFFRKISWHKKSLHCLPWKKHQTHTHSLQGIQQSLLYF